MIAPTISQLTVARVDFQRKSSAIYHRSPAFSLRCSVPMASSINPLQNIEGEGKTLVPRSTESKKLLDFQRIVEPRASACKKDLCRLRWLSSQIIGAEAAIVSPFGRRRIVYCDHIASGRFLRCIEEYLITEVLPFYGSLVNLLLHHFNFSSAKFSRNGRPRKIRKRSLSHSPSLSLCIYILSSVLFTLSIFLSPLFFPLFPLVLSLPPSLSLSLSLLLSPPSLSLEGLSDDEVLPFYGSLVRSSPPSF